MIKSALLDEANQGYMEPIRAWHHPICVSYNGDLLHEKKYDASGKPVEVILYQSIKMNAHPAHCYFPQRSFPIGMWLALVSPLEDTQQPY